MGLEAVGSVFREAHRLGDKHAARSLLVWMAYQVLDKPRGGQAELTYWGGFRTASIGLGYRLAELDDPARAQAALTAVKRAMRDLEAARLIERTRRSSQGRTAEWRLTLDPLDLGAVDNSARRSNRGGRRPTSTGVEDRPEIDEDRPVHGSVTDLIGGR